jgi:hypothetical protein
MRITGENFKDVNNINYVNSTKITHHKDTEITEEILVLEEFLSYPLGGKGTDAIIKKFACLPDAVYCKSKNDSKNVFESILNHREQERFVFIKGTRSDAATLVAHADTFWQYNGHHYMRYEGRDCIVSDMWSLYGGFGIGADGRAGCAILWLLRNSGHNILVTDGGANTHYSWYGNGNNIKDKTPTGTKYMMEKHRDIAEIIYKSSFMLQFNLVDKKYYDCCDIPVSDDFIKYIEDAAGYKQPESPIPAKQVSAGNNPTEWYYKHSFVDVVTLCKHKCSCCAANLSAGYYNPYTSNEVIYLSEWFNTYSIVKEMLDKKLQRFQITMPS